MSEDKSEFTEEEAVKLAEWVGVEMTEEHPGRFYCYFKTDENITRMDRSCLVSWLSSAEGERALMDKCEECFIMQEHWPASDNDIVYKLTSGSYDWLPHRNVYAKSRQPTRVLALQHAILEAIK